MYKLFIRYKNKLFDFFFEPTTSINLGICRLIFYGIIFLIYLDNDFSMWGDIPSVLWHPIVLLELFPIPILAYNILGFLGNLWLATLLFSSIGFFTRINTMLAFLLGTYLLSFTNSIGKAHHIESLFILVLLILALSYCGDGFSLDKLINDHLINRRSKFTRFKGEYSWPTKLIWVLTTFVFCAAGFSKLRNSGIEWITTDTLANYFIGIGFVKSRSDPMIDWLPFWIATKPFIYHTLAALTIILEVLAPLALFNRYLRITIISGLFIMLSSFWIILGIPFPQMQTIFIFFVPWERLAANLGIINKQVQLKIKQADY